MNVDEFVMERTPTWQRLESLVSGARARPERLGAMRTLDLGAAYREVVADLAYARRRFRGDPVVARLERLVVAARPLVYRRPPTGDVGAYVTRGYWRRVAERPVFLAVAAVLLFGSALVSGAWAWRDPQRAQGMVPSSYQSVTEPRRAGADLGLPVDQQGALATQILTHNIQVAFLAFAAGIVAGLGTAFLLLQNGVMLGVVGGLSISAGNGRAFFGLVVAHGMLELSCIVVAAAAGLRIGWALVEPGRRTRGDALRVEARAAIEMVLGTAVFLVVAGLVEGFVTPSGQNLSTNLVIGSILAVSYWTAVIVLGRARRAITDAPGF